MSVNLSAATVANDFAGELIGADTTIRTLSSLSKATSQSLTFATDAAKYEIEIIAAVAAGASVLVPHDALFDVQQGSGSLITVPNPRATFAQVANKYFVAKSTPGISSTAVVDPTAQVDESASIGAYTVIRGGAVIGPRTEIRDHVVIGERVQIGGDNLIKSHAVIGEEGFGIEQDEAGNNFRIPHTGSVITGDHVEVGCFTTVCSGTIEPTTVGDYTKIDDHVHVAHNCQIGRNAVVTACAEISGSVVLEDRVWLGPNVSIIEGVTLGEDALLGIGAVAVKSIPANEVRVGNPARTLGPNKK